MSVIEEISKLLKNKCDDDVLLEYINESFDEIECEMNGEVYEKPKKARSLFLHGL